ncbi:MAG: CoA transferase [Myxococcales bacterium]|nr:CoA transferase [Myxococcales bacterium]
MAGIRVVDLTTGVAGAYAAKLLADAGASVIAVEPPEGHALRRRGLSQDSFDAAGDGLLFRYLRTSQRSLALDLEREADRDLLRGLYREADLVLESRPEGWLDARGIGREALARANARASWLSISAFGRGGPWSDRPANDFTLQAWCGSTASRGRSGQPPLAAGGEVGDWLSGTVLAVGALAALRGSDRDGVGATVDVSKLEAILPTLTNAGSVWGHLSGVWQLPASEDVPSIEPTADGWIGFCLFTSQQWQDFAVLIERPELGLDPSLNHMMTRVARSAELVPIVRDYTRRHTTAELLERCELLRVPAAPIGNGESLPKLDHLRTRGVFVRNPRGDFLQPRIPYASSAWPRRPFEPAPTLEVARRRDATWPEAARRPPASRPAPGAAPLEGLRVLDLTAFWAGPYGTYVLAGLGADVIHVESIQRPDGMRFGTMAKPDMADWWEYGPTFHSANAGKRSLTLDLTRADGVELLMRLVAVSDVVVENFSPRVMDNFGIDAARIEAANPRAIFVRMPAFGLDGPWRERVGFAQTMEQVSGLAWMTAYGPDAGERAGPLTPRACADPLAGLHAAFAVLAALAHRDRTGRGCAIESVMVETALGVAAEGILEYDATGVLMRGDGNRSPHLAPQGLYACAGRDELGGVRWLALSVEDEIQWRALAERIGRSAWGTDPRFATAAGRRAGGPEIDAAIATWAAAHEPEAAAEALLAVGVPAAVVRPTRSGTSLPPVVASDFVQTARHSIAGDVPTPTHPLRLVHGPPRRLARPAPRLGEHNAEILEGLLGLDDAELARLERERVIGTRPAGL